MQAAQTVTPNTQQTGASQSASAKSQGNEALESVDFQNFLVLLTAQLRNQDPLNPADSTEFVAQLAQFSSVEQLVNVNNKIDKLASALVAEGIDKYAGWIGKQAEVISSPTYFDGETPVGYRLSGNSQAVSVQTVITNSAGNEVARFTSLNGAMAQSWDGKLNNGDPAAPGVYAVTAVYYDSKNNSIGKEIANTFGTVQAVRLDGENPYLVLDGGVELTPDQVTGLGQ
ncbi:flagellar hook assembly protein FlgD [Hyphococcus sp.]|uniref:flagellar hook assembly protein FlgD n=1 Tax=Hyphococcus sp. TaxID=2038636 RepID=UPI003D0E1C5A